MCYTTSVVETRAAEGSPLRPQLTSGWRTAYTTMSEATETVEGDVPQTPTTLYRAPEVISADIGAAATSGDTRRIRELANELQEALKRQAQAEMDERNQRKASFTTPLRDQFVRIMDRQDGLMDFIRECGGVLSFVYTMPAEGSENGPEVSINIAEKPTAAAARAPRQTSSGGSSTGGGRGKTYIVNGASMALADAFEAVATEQDKSDLAARMDQANTDKSKNSAAWAVKSRVVNEAIKAGRITVQE